MYFLLKLLLISGVLVLIPKPSLAEFVPLRKDQTKSCNLQLAEAENIPHNCQIITDTSNSLEVWQDRLSFHFGKISQSEFNQLKETYSGWSKSPSIVPYNPNRSYQLIDFLPTLIQALNSHRFIPESTIAKSQDRYLKQFPSSKKKQLYMNCWGVVYEVLRAAINPQAQPAIFMAQGSQILKQLRDNSQQLLVLSEPEFPLPPQSIKPGDVILITHTSSTGQEYLDHTAIAIADGIYFEKAGTGANVPIRIIDEATLLKIWIPGVFRYEVRRLKQDAKLPHSQKVFSLNSPVIEQEFSLLKELPLKIRNQTSIMWEEEEKNLATTSWFHLITTLPISSDITGKASLSPQLYQPLL